VIEEAYRIEGKHITYEKGKAFYEGDKPIARIFR